jgi:hypothetical protein
MQPVPDNVRGAVFSLAASAAAGTGSMEDVVRRVVAESGLHPDEARQRITYAQQVYQAQADSFLVHRVGIAESDLPAFYETVRKDPRTMQRAINEQTLGKMTVWRELANKHYFSKEAPRVDALAAAGYETRNVSGTPEVRIGGFWASVKGAARAGLI